MKRRDLLRHLEVSGCYLFREGARHTIKERNKPDNKKSFCVLL
jgi:hypothetical protein